MIVLDEQLNDERIISAIKRWYKGKVLVISELRPETVIKDDVIPALLLQQKSPVFVTINYKDFWRKIPAHRGYCAICFKLSLDRKLEVPERLREVLSLDEFNTWRKHRGKVLSIAEDFASFYE